jgi:hypothetical protein
MGSRCLPAPVGRDFFQHLLKIKTYPEIQQGGVNHGKDIEGQSVGPKDHIEDLPRGYEGLGGRVLTSAIVSKEVFSMFRKMRLMPFPPSLYEAIDQIAAVQAEIIGRRHS